MKLSVKEVARLFNISEKTVYRWIQTDNLPHYRIGGQYRFSHSELLEWAAIHGTTVQSDLIAEIGEHADSPISIADAIELGGIHYRIEGSSKEDVLRSVVSSVKLPDGVNRDIFLQFILARERLGTTAIGEGIAIPHVRNPVVFHSEQPQVSLFFLEKPVDFGALDGIPVSILFLIISPNIATHLKLLSHLMFVLKNSEVLAVLKGNGTRNEILLAVRNAEASFAQTTRTAEIQNAF